MKHQCERCNQFYHREYPNCPFCGAPNLAQMRKYARNTEYSRQLTPYQQDLMVSRQGQYRQRRMPEYDVYGEPVSEQPRSGNTVGQFFLLVLVFMVIALVFMLM